MNRKSIKMKEVWTDYTICMVCGDKMKQLVSHLRHKHKMTTKEYRELYPGFPIQCGDVAKMSKGDNNPNFKHGNLVRNELKGIEGQDYVTCQECGKKVRMLTASGHLYLHRMTRREYEDKYQGHPVNCTDFLENTNSVVNLDAEERSRRAIKGLEGRAYGHRTFTAPHKAVTKILTNLSQKHTNEVVFLGRNIDIQISDTLFIEIQGDYWHCNPMKYEEPISNNQEHKIGLDVIKANIFKKNGISILYLWEMDILKRPKVCKILIEKYIRGDLTNFHSFNYNDSVELQQEMDFYY